MGKRETSSAACGSKMHMRQREMKLQPTHQGKISTWCLTHEAALNRAEGMTFFQGLRTS